MFLTVILYRKSKLFQKIINMITNVFFPLLKKDVVILGVFSKEIATTSSVLKNYLLQGYKYIKVNYIEDFKSIQKKESLYKIIMKQEKKIKNAKKGSKNSNSVVYLGFPHIPIGFFDGYNFTDLDDAILYEYQGDSKSGLDKGFFELKKIYNSELKLETNYKEILTEESEINSEIILKVEQSYKIDDMTIKEIVGEVPIVYLRNKDIKRWGIISYADVDIFQREFNKILNAAQASKIRKIHLVATTPTSLTFSLGRVIKHYHPEIIVYNFNGGCYDWSLNIKQSKVNILK